MSEVNWQIYIIECDDKSLYTGITNNLIHRFEAHRSGRGAKYFRRCRPLQVVYQELGYSHSEAARREYQIKKLSKAQKSELIRRNLCLE